MKVTLNWLKDFVDIALSPQDLAQRLTMAGLEVGGIEEKAGDVVFEIEITSNRPDWLSVMGIAREVSALTAKKMRPILPAALTSSKTGAKTPRPIFDISVEDKKDCPLYTARIIADLKVGPSPAWLKERLELVGCRSINNVVDITNYVLFTTGEPLHAFDLDALERCSGIASPEQLAIIVRRGRPKEELVTIDGINRPLDCGTLVIAAGNKQSGDLGKPVALAGIMGGKDSEVSENTKNILLEGALFDPVLIRTSRQKLGLNSESSYRFERGVAYATVESAPLLAQELILQLAAGRCISSGKSGKPAAKKKAILINPGQVNAILGTSLVPSRMAKILADLGFELAARKGVRAGLEVFAPSHRLDINSQIDVVEEVARIYGFDKIPTTLPRIRPALTNCPAADFVPGIKNILVSLGLNEVVTYSLIDAGLLKFFPSSGASEIIEIRNPLSQEQASLRPQIIPSLAACVARNLHRGQEYIAIFEIARIFSWEGKAAKEELMLGGALCAKKVQVSEKGRVEEEMGFLHVKGTLETLFDRLGVGQVNLMDRGNGEAALLAGRENVGRILKLPRQALSYLDIKNKEVYAFELSLDGIRPFVKTQKKYLPLPKYPDICRDISLVVKDEVTVKDIEEAIILGGKPLLSGVKLADFYKGEQIPEGFKGLTFSCSYQSSERTLSESEITPTHSRICLALVESFGARIR